MSLDFHLFRLSLKSKDNYDLFERRSPVGFDLSREQWLRSFFTEEQIFRHYNSDFHYIPEQEVVNNEKDFLIYGWIAREITHLERTPPREGLEPTTHKSWQAAFIVIDPRDHREGQLVAVESSNDIAGPKALIRSIAKKMNDKDGSPFYTHAFPLVSEGSFATFASLHGEDIVSITFDVAAPNMFNDKNDFQNELRSLRDHENVAEIKTTLKSDTQLNYKTPRITDIVEYIERGAGELSAEAADGSRYSSSQHERKEMVEIESPSRNMRRFLREIASRINWFFP